MDLEIIFVKVRKWFDWCNRFKKINR